jgi:hypothetical protein
LEPGQLKFILVAAKCDLPRAVKREEGMAMAARLVLVLSICNRTEGGRLLREWALIYLTEVSASSKADIGVTEVFVEIARTVCDCCNG